MKPEKYAEELRKGVGFDRAIKVAEARMKGCSPTTWETLPKGSVFYEKDRRGNVGLNERSLRKTYEFWKQVFHILKKKDVKNVK